MTTVCKFSFYKNTDPDFLEAQLALAIMATEGVHGQAKVRMCAAYAISRKKRQLVIDVSTDVGMTITQIFTWFIIKGMGEENFKVDMINHQGRDL